MIPIYRAKKIDSDEYVEGYLTENIHSNKVSCTFQIMRIWDTESEINPYYEDYSQIDPATLSIHFPDMLDSQGQKIFASLSESGKGGDIVDMGYNYIKCTMKIGKSIFNYNYEKSKVIGMQK